MSETQIALKPNVCFGSALEHLGHTVMTTELTDDSGTLVSVCAKSGNGEIAHFVRDYVTTFYRKMRDYYGTIDWGDNIQ